MGKENEENKIRIVRNDGKVEVTNFQEALDALVAMSQEQQQPTESDEEFNKNHDESVNKVTYAIEKDVFQELMEKPVSEEQLQKESQHPSVLDGGNYEALVNKLADIIGNEVEKNKLDLGILLGDLVVISTKMWLGEGYYEDGGGWCTKLWQKYDMLSYYTQVHLVNVKHHVDYFFEELKKLWWPKKESDNDSKVVQPLSEAGYKRFQEAMDSIK